MIAVSSGSTPRLMFQAMAQRPFDWSNVQLFQVDERCVPPDHELSNFRVTRESPLSAARIDESQFHRISGELPPEEAARLYMEEVRETFHLAPGEPLIRDRTGIAAAVYVEKMMQHRVTLLPGVLERARHTLCLVTGADKAEPLRQVLKGPYHPDHSPSQIASPDTVWYIDKGSGAKL
jgi:6-phosphogluconolactonase